MTAPERKEPFPEGQRESFVFSLAPPFHPPSNQAALLLIIISKTKSYSAEQWTRISHSICTITQRASNAVHADPPPLLPPFQPASLQPSLKCILALLPGQLNYL